MVELVSMRDLKPWGYEVESVWGTDPATTRLPFLGDMKSASIVCNDNKEARRSVGSGMAPKGFARKKRDVNFEWEMDLIDDNPANSLIALALGSAPNAGTGVITNYPDATHSNLRSFTVEGGFVWSGTDEFWKVIGARISNLALELAENRVRMTGKAVCQDRFRGASATVASPTESSLALFDGYSDAALTWASPALTLTQSISKLRLTIDNALKADGEVGNGSRNIAYSQVVGREVSIELETSKVDSEFLDMLDADPSTAAAEINLAVVLSKHVAAEYIYFQLNDCQIVSESKFDTKDSDEMFGETFRLIAKSYGAQVKV